MRTGDRRVRTLSLVIQYGQLPPPTHVVAHLSDIHLLAGDARQYDAIDTFARLEAALDRVARIDPPPHALVFTGDLADVADPEAYRLLRERGRAAGRTDRRHGGVVHGEPRRARGVLARAVRPGVGGAAGPGVRRGRPTDRQPRHECPGVAPRRGRATQQLTWLAHVLATPAEHGTILALHHPPIPSPDGAGRRGHRAARPGPTGRHAARDRRPRDPRRSLPLQLALDVRRHPGLRRRGHVLPRRPGPARQVHLRCRREHLGQRRARLRRPGGPHDRAGAGGARGQRVRPGRRAAGGGAEPGGAAGHGQPQGLGLQPREPRADADSGRRPSLVRLA